jgi:biotin/methionine sulfoxide reductase
MASTIYNGSHFGTYAVSREGDRIRLGHNGLEAADYGVRASFEEILTSPLRIRRPAVRKSFLEGRPGNAALRGEEPFIEVDWTTALDLTADALRQIYSDHGPASIFGGSYGWASAGRFHHAQSQIHRFLGMAGGYTGSRNTYSHGAAEVLLPHVVGTEDDILYKGTTWPVIAENSDYIVAFGGLPAQTGMISPGGATEHTNDYWITECARRGVKLITIAPVKSAYDRAFDSKWLALRPNSDTALMLALAHVLYRNGWHDAAFLESHTIGFEKFVPYLTGDVDGVPKTPEWAAPICGIPVHEITGLAAILHDHRCFLTATFALQRAEHGEQPFFMLVVLAAMLGQIGLPGGGFGFGLTSFNAVAKPISRLGFGSLSQGHNPVRTRIPVACITEMLENPGGCFVYDGGRYLYPDIQAIYWAGGNPFHHHQDLNRLRRAWKKPQLVVCHDIEWNATARQSDIVLPVCSTLERNDVMSSKYDPYIVAMKKVRDPVGESRTDYDIFCDLAARLGWRERFSEGLDEMGWLRRLYETGQRQAAAQNIDMPAFDIFWAEGIFYRPHEILRRTMLSRFRENPAKHRLGTPSGRIEIFSQPIADMALSDCPGHPTWIAPQEWLGAETAARYPLHLLSPQPRHRLHGQLDGNAASRGSKINGREPLYISPVDAEQRRILDGDVIRVFNDRGMILCGASVLPDLAEGVVLVETGAWFSPDAALGNGCASGNPNVLTADRKTSDLARGCAANSALVEVERYDGPFVPVLAHQPPEFAVVGKVV